MANGSPNAATALADAPAVGKSFRWDHATCAVGPEKSPTMSRATETPTFAKSTGFASSEAARETAHGPPLDAGTRCNDEALKEGYSDQKDIEYSD